MATTPQNPPPVAPGGNAGPPSLPSGPDAGALAQAAGGNKGGRPRKDGLVPGSPEAIEADRKRDANRKRDERAAARALAGGPGDGPRPLPAAAGPPGPLPGPAGPGLGPGPGVVPWDPSVLAPIFAQVVPAVERAAVAGLVKRAAKIPDAPRGFVADVEKDAAWNPAAKASVVAAGPAALAGWLNAAGISAERAPDVILATAVASIAAGHFLLAAKLDRMIAEHGPAPAPAPTTPRP